MSPKHNRNRTAIEFTTGCTTGCTTGFTLIEILVVIVIIAILASLVAPQIFRHVGDAKSDAAKSQIETLALALNAYRLDTGVYPTTAQGLEALRTKPSAPETSQRWNGPYLARMVPHDPWGRPYIYRSPGRVNASSYDLYTLGRDGVVNGTDEDADITSWHGPVTGTVTGTVTDTSSTTP